MEKEKASGMHSHGGIMHSHPHTHGHTHPHVHSDDHKKKMLNRISRVMGHLAKVRQMIETDCDCSDTLIQIAAVKAAISNMGKEIAKEHISSCLKEAIEHGDYSEIEDFKKTLDKLF